MYPQFLQTIAAPFLKMGNVGIKPDTDIETRYNIIAINVLSWTTAVVAAFGPASIYFFIERDSLIIIPGLIESAACLLVVYLNHRQRYKAAAMIFYILQCFAITYFGTAFDRNVGVQQMCYFLAGLGMLLFKRLWIRIFCFCLTLTTIYLLEINYTNNLFNLASQSSIRYIVYPVILLLNFIVILLYEAAKDARRKEAEGVNHINRLIALYIAKLNHDSGNALHRLSNAIQSYMPNGNMEATIPAYIMAVMKNNCDELQLLNYNLLTYAKIQTLTTEKVTKQPIAIKKMLESCADAFQLNGQRKSVLVSVEYSDNLPAGIMGDHEKLLRIINNLLSNALKFTANRSIIKLKAISEGHLLKISVADHGCGIPEHMKEKIFEHYISQENQKEPSTGLGLPIAKYFANLMGGDLQLIESVIGYGSTFELIIPFEQAVVKEESPANAPVFEDFVVLVVDDDDVNHLITELMLKRSSIKIVKAVNAAEALSAIEKVIPDVILLDLELPDMRGDQLILKLKENRMTRQIPIILSSGNSEIQNIAGTVGFLEKPFTAPALFKMFQKIKKAKGIA